MKRLPSLTPAQRRALLVLEWALLLGIVGVAVWQSKTPKTAKDEITRKREWRGTPLQQYTYAVEETPVETFPFDPNTADSSSLLRLGLSPWQVRSIYRYRAQHGRYHKPEDFMRLPGMTNEQWERLKDYIRIAPEFRYLDPPPRKVQTSSKGKEFLSEQDSTTTQESLPIEGEVLRFAQAQAEWRGSVKLSPGQTIDINTADTTQLKMIPGIGSKRAAHIVAYRRALGGFVSVEQAMEATEMPDSVLKYMNVVPQPVRKINVNKLSVQRLMNHPYLNFYQAKAINEYRRNKGDLHSIEEFSRLEAFRPTDIDRLQPYIEF